MSVASLENRCSTQSYLVETPLAIAVFADSPYFRYRSESWRLESNSPKSQTRNDAGLRSPYVRTIQYHIMEQRRGVYSTKPAALHDCQRTVHGQESLQGGVQGMLGLVRSGAY